MARAPRPHTRTRFERRRLPVAHAMRLLRHSEDEGRADGLRQRHDLAHRLRVLPLARLHQDEARPPHCVSHHSGDRQERHVARLFDLSRRTHHLSRHAVGHDPRRRRRLLSDRPVALERLRLRTRPHRRPHRQVPDAGRLPCRRRDLHNVPHLDGRQPALRGSAIGVELT